jgi:hypothetical protein
MASGSDRLTTSTTNVDPPFHILRGLATECSAYDGRIRTDDKDVDLSTATHSFIRNDQHKMMCITTPLLASNTREFMIYTIKRKGKGMYMGMRHTNDGGYGHGCGGDQPGVFRLLLKRNRGCFVAVS